MQQLRQQRAWLPLLFLGIILLGAAYLRLRDLAYTGMTGDQGILYSIALEWVKGGSFPLTANKASAGIMNPPLVEYLIALPLMLRPALVAAAQFQALLGLLALLLLYAYSAHLFNWRVALLATFLFAFNPWAVHYSRFVWNPNPVPFFSTLLLGSLLIYLTRRDAHPLHLALVVVAFAAMTQLHLSSLVVGITLALVALFCWRRLWRGSWWPTLWPFLLGLLLALLLYLPYIYFQSTVDFADLGNIFAALVGGQETASGSVPPAQTNWASWLLVQELATGDNMHRAAPAWLAAVPSLDWLFALARLLLVAGLLYAFARPLFARLRPAPATGRAEDPSSRTIAYLVLAVWILVPVFAYLRHTIYLQNYYFLYLWPAPFLLIALLLDDLLRWLRPRFSPLPFSLLGALLLAPVLLLGLLHFYINYVGLALVESGQLRPERTLGQVQEVVTTSQELLAQYPGCDLTVVAEDALLERSAFAPLRPFLQPRPVRTLQAGHGYVIPHRCSLYLLTEPDPALESWLAGSATRLPAAIRREQTTWPFYYVPPASPPRAEALATWQNGLELLEVELPEAPPAGAGTLPLIYRWYVAQEPPPASYHFFNHVLDEQGQLVAQLDAVAIDSRNWHAGDRLITPFALSLPALPPGRYRVIVGLYTWPEIVRVPLQGGRDTYPVYQFEVPE